MLVEEVPRLSVLVEVTSSRRKTVGVGDGAQTVLHNVDGVAAVSIALMVCIGQYHAFIGTVTAEHPWQSTSRYAVDVDLYTVDVPSHSEHGFVCGTVIVDVHPEAGIMDPPESSLSGSGIIGPPGLFRLNGGGVGMIRFAFGIRGPPGFTVPGSGIIGPPGLYEIGVGIIGPPGL
jgi:hypothetical protein